MTAALQPYRDLADQVIDQAVDSALFGSDPVLIVKSPPGAGKTFLVECAVAVAVERPQMRVVVVTPGVSQLYDIAGRLLEYRLPRLELAHASDRHLPTELVGRINDSNGWDATLNFGPGVVVTNAHLLASYLHRLGPGSFDLMIVDEAYQLAAAAQTFAIPCTARLKSLLDGHPRRSTLILSTKQGRPFKKRYFISRWAAICRDAGIEGGLHFHDLRGTTVTLLAEAGCTVPEIASITGHSLRTAQAILDRYLARTDQLRSQAVGRLENKIQTDSANRAAN